MIQSPLKPCFIILLFLVPCVSVAQSGDAFTSANATLVEASNAIEKEQTAALPAMIPKLEQARATYHQLGKPTYEAVAILALGRAFSLLDDQQHAIRYLEESLAIWRTIGERSGEATTLTGLGAAYSRRGEKRKALGFYEQALVIFDALKDRKSKALVLDRLAAVHSFLNEKQAALDLYRQAADVYGQVGNRKEQASSVTSMAAAYLALGEYGKALSTFAQSLKLQKEIGDKAGQADTLNYLGSVYDSLGEYSLALDSFEEAWNLIRDSSNKKTEAATVHNIAAVFDHTNDPVKAEQTYEIALMLRREAKDKSGEAVTLNNLSLVQRSRNETEKALASAQQALALFRELHDKRGEAAALMGLASIRDKQGDIPQALELYQQAFPLLRVTREQSGQISVLESLMEGWQKLNQPRLSIFYGKIATNLQQSVRGQIRTVDREMQQAYLRKSDWGYRNLAKLLLSEGRLSEAHQVLNFFKDQTSFDYERAISPNELPPLKRQYLTAEEEAALGKLTPVSEKLDTLDKQLGELQLALKERKPTVEEAQQLAQLDTQIKTVSIEYRNVIKQIEEDFRRQLQTTAAQTEDTVEMQAALRQVSAETKHRSAAVYTLVLADSLQFLLVTPEKVISLSRPIKAEDINRKALAFLGLLRDPSAEPRVLAKALYDIIFAPVAAEVEKEKIETLTWSLDGTLRYIPIPALYDGKQYLVERYQNVVFTRAAKDRMLASVSPRWTGLGAGTSEPHQVELLGRSYSFSALQGVSAELDQIFSPSNGQDAVLNGEVLLNEHFSFANLQAALQTKPRVLHISSHFQFEPGDEARSFLVLGDGGVLPLDELKEHGKLFAGLELLTLSACQTAAQQKDERTGREIDGFGELAQRLGAGAVIASLWKVGDASTAQLMVDFYNGRERRNLSKAEALRQAQIKLMRGKYSAAEVALKRGGEIIGARGGNQTRFTPDENAPFAHPYYWAPFILIGNWK